VVWKPDYVTSAVLKSYLRIMDTADDDFVARWITAASRNVDGYCGRQFGKTDAPVTRTYRRPVWDRKCQRWVYVVDDVYDPAGMVVTDADATVVTDLDWEPENAAADGVPAQRVLARSCGPLSFTGSTWGWETQPASIELGMLLMAARLAARRDSPFGIAGSPAEGSEVIRLSARLDPDMIVLLKNGKFRRTWWAR
jgi:hypothetical protein